MATRWTFVRHPISLTLLLATGLVPGIRGGRRTVFVEAQPGD